MALRWQPCAIFSETGAAGGRTFSSRLCTQSWRPRATATKRASSATCSGASAPASRWPIFRMPQSRSRTGRHSPKTRRRNRPLWPDGWRGNRPNRCGNGFPSPVGSRSGSSSSPMIPAWKWMRSMAPRASAQPGSPPPMLLPRTTPATRPTTESFSIAFKVGHGINVPPASAACWLLRRLRRHLIRLPLKHRPIPWFTRATSRVSARDTSA